jgi:hypothetical protein
LLEDAIICGGLYWHRFAGEVCSQLLFAIMKPAVDDTILSILALNNVAYTRDWMIFVPIDANCESEMEAGVAHHVWTIEKLVGLLG